MCVNCFEVFNCQVLHLSVVVFWGGFFCSNRCVLLWIHHCFIFRDLSFLSFPLLEHKWCFLLAGGADVPVAAVNTQLAPKLVSVSLVLLCQEPVGDHTSSFTDGHSLFKAFKTGKRLANALQ